MFTLGEFQALNVRGETMLRHSGGESFVFELTPKGGGNMHSSKYMYSWTLFSSFYVPVFTSWNEECSMELTIDFETVVRLAPLLNQNTLTVILLIHALVSPYVYGCAIIWLHFDMCSSSLLRYAILTGGTFTRCLFTYSHACVSQYAFSDSRFSYLSLNWHCHVLPDVNRVGYTQSTSETYLIKFPFVWLHFLLPFIWNETNLNEGSSYAQTWSLC